MSDDTSTTKRRRRVALAIIAAAGIVAAGGVWAATGAARMLHEKRAALLRAHVEAHVEEALDAVQATPEQRTEVETILQRTFTQLRTLHADHEALHAQAVTALTAPVVDRDAVEALRVAHMNKAEQGSKIIADALCDVAEVLTPEQRQQLAAYAASRME